MANKDLNRPKDIIVKDLYELVKENYGIYGTGINLFRGFPHVCDGLKPVYRKIIMSMADYSGLVKTNIVIAETMQKYYDHGDLSLAPVVSLLVRQGIFIGQGNHGADLIIPCKPAAMRYTKTGINNDYKEYFFKLIKYAPFTVNDNNINEPNYLITPVPYALIYGSRFDIGMGAGGRIPAFTFDSLVKAYNKQNYNLLISKYNDIIYSESDLEGLWERGAGKITYTLDVKTTFSKEDNQDVVVISGKEGGITPNLSKIDKWLDEGLVWYRDESSPDIGVRIVIGKTFRTRIISDEDILKECVRVSKFSRTFKIVVNVFGILKQIGIKDWLTITMTNYKNTLEEWKKSEIKIIEAKLEEYKYIVDVAKLLMENKNNKEIAELLKIPEDLVNKITRKSLSSLRKTDYSADIDALNKNKKEIETTTIDTQLVKFESKLKFVRVTDE